MTLLDEELTPVLAPNQFSVAQPLGPEDLDRCVTWQWYLPFATSPKWSSMK